MQLNLHFAGLKGNLFIAGQSDCGSEFHLGTLSVSDPEGQ